MHVKKECVLQYFSHLLCVSGEITSPFYVCDNIISCHPLLPILGRKMPTTSFYMFELYLGKTSSHFYGVTYEVCT